MRVSGENEVQFPLVLWETQALTAHPGGGWAFVVRGKARRQSGDLAEALADFRRAVRLDSRDAKARGWEADALRKRGRLGAAAAAAETALRLQPTCAWAAALNGEIERERGRKKRGFELVQRAVRLDPNGSCAHDFLGADPPAVWGDASYAWVYAWRGAIHRKKNDWKAARRDLEHAVELDPGCFWARGWLGELKLASGDAPGALVELAASLKEYSGNGDAWTWQGRAYAELKRWAPALNSFLRAGTLQPSEPWPLIGAATILDRLGRKKEAANSMARAAALAPALFAAQAASAP